MPKMASSFILNIPQYIEHSMSVNWHINWSWTELVGVNTQGVNTATIPAQCNAIQYNSPAKTLSLDIILLLANLCHRGVY